MKTTLFNIGNIPAMLWGKTSDRLFIAVHGNMSHKADTVIELLAKEAAEKGYQTLSFDLPEHGDCKNEGRKCSAKNCADDLSAVHEYARDRFKDMSLFACSMGAYFSLLSLQDAALRQALFLSPVVDMQRLILGMMSALDITEERLKKEQVIPTPFGQTLQWDYYSYVKANQIVRWPHDTAILCAADDKVSEPAAVAAFAKKFNCRLETVPDAEHFFHTEKQLAVFSRWLKANIK